MKKRGVKATLLRAERVISCYGVLLRLFSSLWLIELLMWPLPHFLTVYERKRKWNAPPTMKPLVWPHTSPCNQLLHPSRSSTTPAMEELLVARVGHCSWPPRKENKCFDLLFFSVMVPFITMAHIHWLSLAFFSVGFIPLFCFEYWCSTSLTWLHCQMVSRRSSSSD